METKIMSITCGKYKFLDSLNFLQTSLAKLPKMFNFSGTKGYFPHLFNIKENQNYSGPFQRAECYSYDQMNKQDIEDHFDWWALQNLIDITFNLKRH